MNRYSRITTSEFNPLSFQEIMAAPLAMRQKHDSLDAQRELLRQGLAKTNPHEKYYEEAVKLKDELNNQINTQAELLAKEGVNPNSQSEFLKLNRNYQETMSPTGKLGMINAHNVNLQSTYKNYIDEAIKAGQSPAIAKLHADQAIQKHMKESLYDERGRVVDFSAGNAAPKYIDNIKWINELATNVGFSKNEWENASSGISQDANGRFIVNSSAKGMTKSNIENLNRLAQMANSQVSDPSSEIRQNIDYNFKNPQTELNNMLNQLYSKTINEKDRGQNRSISSMDWKNIDDSNGAGNMELIVNNEVFKPNSLATNTFVDNKNRLNTLQSKSNLTPDERTELSGLKDFQSNITKDLSKNLEYQNAKKQQDLFYNKYSKNVQTLLKNPILKNSAEFTASNTKGVFNVKTPSGDLLRGGDGKVLNFTPQQMKTFYKDRGKTSNVDNKIFEIENKVTNENSVKYNGYQLVPITPEDATSIKLANDTFENALRANPENLLNLTNIESVDVEGGRREGKDLDSTDKKAIQQLFNGSERGNLKIVSFIPKGFSGKPEYIVEFNTKEGNSTNLNRYFRNESGSGNLGDGKPVRLKLSYKQSKGDVLNNANGYIQQYLSNKGPVNPNTGKPVGRDLALEMRANADKSVLNDQLSNAKWSDIVTKNTDFSKLNPFIVKQLQSELKRYGLTNDTDDNELQNIINKFIKDNSNKNIYLE